MNTTTPVKVIKGMRGFYAQTDIPFNEKQVIRIHTGKNSRGLNSYAQVGTVANDCGMESFSFIMFSDYNKNIATSDKRCTENAVRELHQTALAQVDNIVIDATNFYAAKNSKA